MSDDPVRLFDAQAGTPAVLRDAIGAARDEVPSDALLASLEERLRPFFGPGGGGGGGGAEGAGGVGAAAKIAMLLGTAATLAGAVALYVATRPEDAAPAVAANHDAGPMLVRTDDAGSRDEIAPDAGLPDSGLAEIPAVPRRGGPERDPTAELELLEPAQLALRDGDPARALALAGEHARRFPRGSLAEEREIAAIQALLALGRRADAVARGTAFRSRWPRSANVRRISVLLGDSPPVP